MLSFYNKHNNYLYNKLVELSRNIFFYKDVSLKDNFETRVILIFIHLSLILIIFKKKNKKKFPQNIFDNIFLNIEYHLREIGHGDVSVNKKMKILNRNFYDILLKIEEKKIDKFTINASMIKKHLLNEINDESKYMSKLTSYFEDFYDFCFELDHNIMLKGQINYKN
jgi:cytochrome b pre-mRNA-processing protein 3